MKKKKAPSIEDLGITPFSPEFDAFVDKKTEEAEEDVLTMRLQVRWKEPQIQLIKKAAKLMGIPCETYIKQTLYRQAIDDIERGTALLS